MSGMARVAHSAVTDAYEKGFQDGVTETLAQRRMRFNVSVIDGLQDFGLRG